MAEWTTDAYKTSSNTQEECACEHDIMTVLDLRVSAYLTFTDETSDCGGGIDIYVSGDVRRWC